MILGITLSHPHGNPNSYHAARAFAEAGLLKTFEQGITNHGVISKLLSRLPGNFKRVQQRNSTKFLADQQRPHLFWETIAQLGKHIRPVGPSAALSWYDILFCGHDWQVSRALEKGMSAVYAYEDGAHYTFRAAKQTNALTIYELPAGYYAGAAYELGRFREEAPELKPGIKSEPQWKVRRKNDELLLADLIVVPCEWAAESLRFSRIDKKQAVIKVPYGTPSDEMTARSIRPAGPFTVLFAGNVGVRKGVPYLLEAWSRLGLKNARLWLVGGMGLDETFLRRYSGTFEHFGAVPRGKLLELMKRADLLVFPSLAEGFGLVIGEAMASGIPVLTTTNTGGPELITDGQEGWCVPAHDIQILAERIEWAYQHRDELFEMGRLARRKAEQWTWSHYRSSLIEKIIPYLKRASTDLPTS